MNVEDALFQLGRALHRKWERAEHDGNAELADRLARRRHVAFGLLTSRRRKELKAREDAERRFYCETIKLRDYF